MLTLETLLSTWILTIKNMCFKNGPAKSMWIQDHGLAGRGSGLRGDVGGIGLVR